MTHTNPTDAFLWHELAILLLTFALSGVILALLLIFKPQLLERFNRVANRWVSTRPVSQLLDRSFSIERWFHQHHRPVGIVIVLGSSYMLIYFGFLFDKAYTLQRWSGMLPAQLLDVLLNAIASVREPPNHNLGKKIIAVDLNIIVFADDSIIVRMLLDRYVPRSTGKKNVGRRIFP